MKNTMIKKAFAFLLTLMMVVNLLPASVLASEPEQTIVQTGYEINAVTSDSGFTNDDNTICLVAFDAQGNAQQYAPIPGEGGKLQFHRKGNSLSSNTSTKTSYRDYLIVKPVNKSTNVKDISSKSVLLANATDYQIAKNGEKLGDHYFSWSVSEGASNGTITLTISKNEPVDESSAELRSAPAGSNVFVTVNAVNIDLSSSDGSRYYLVAGSNDAIAPYQWTELNAASPAGDYGFTVERLSEVDTMFVLLKRYEPGENPTPETLDHQIVFNLGQTNTLDIGGDTYNFTWSDDGNYHYTITITKENQGGGGGEEPTGDGHTAVIKLGKGVNLDNAYVMFFARNSTDNPDANWGGVAYPLSDANAGKTFTVDSGTTFPIPYSNGASYSYDECNEIEVWVVTDVSGGIQEYHFSNHGSQIAGKRINNPYNGKTVTSTTSGNTTTIQIGEMPAYGAEIIFKENNTQVTPNLKGKYYILAGVDEGSYDFYAPINADGSVGDFSGTGLTDDGKLPGIQSLKIIEYTGNKDNPTLTDLIGADSTWINDGGDLDGYTVAYPETLEPEGDTLTFTANGPKRYTSTITFLEANGTPQASSAELNGNKYILASKDGEPLYYAAVPTWPNPSELVFRDSNGKIRDITADLTFEVKNVSNGNASFNEVVSANTSTTLGKYVLTSEYNEGDGTCTFTARKSDEKAVNVVYYINGGEQTDPNPVVTGDFYLIISVDGDPLYYGKINTTGSNMSFSNGVENYNGIPSGSNVTFKLVEYTGAAANPTLDELNALPEAHKLSKYDWSRDETVTDHYVFKAVASSDLYVRVSTYEADNTTPLIPEEAITGQYYIRVALREAPVTDENKDNLPQLVGYCMAPFEYTPNAEYTDVKLTKFVASDKSAFADDASAPPLSISSYYPDYENVRVLKLKDEGNKPATYAQACDTENYVDDSAPEGWAFAGKDTTSDGCNVHLKRAEKTPRYHVRLKFDTTDPSKINLDGGTWLKVTVYHESGPDTYGFIKLSNAEHKKAQYLTVDQDNGCIYIDIPITEWKNANDEVIQSERYTGNEKGIDVKLSYGPDGSKPNTTGDIPEHDYINSAEIAAYPTDHLTVESENYIDVYDVVTMHLNDNKFSGYTLEEILNGYNIVALCPNNVVSPSTSDPSAFGDGDFLMEKHQMGGVLIRGDIIYVAGSGLADSSDIKKPSVVGGYVPTFGDSFFNNRQNNNNGWNSYIGSVNTVAGDHYVNGQYVQGRGYTGTNTGVTVVDDNYIDWDRLQNMVISTSNSLGAAASASAATYDSDNNVYTVQAGSNALINYPEKTIVTINIEVKDENGNYVQFEDKTGQGANNSTVTYKDYSGILGTVVTNLGTGTYYPPKVQINGVPLNATVEDGSGMSLLWNYPNAKEIYIPSDVTPQFGHVVAPKAFINAPEEGNNSGCLVGNKVRSKLEGHLYPYKGATLIGFYGDLGFNKTVNGKKPKDSQKYDFTLEKLSFHLTNSEYTERMSKLTGDDKEQRVFWQRLQTMQNEAETGNNASHAVNFEDISFDSAGTYYFRAYENPATITNTTLDSHQFLIEIKVGSHLECQDKYVLQVDSIKYYDIDTTKQLLDISSSTSGKSASINLAAITGTHTLSWDQTNQNCNTGITFENEVADAKCEVTLTGSKTLENRTSMTDGEFTYSVKNGDTLITTGENKADGTIEFEKITYLSTIFTDPAVNEITYTYTVTEDRPTEGVTYEDNSVDNTYIGSNGITYDGSSKTVNVKVTINPATNEMEAKIVEGSDAISFTNYDHQGTATLKVKKSVSGNTEYMTDNEKAKKYTFTLAKDPGNEKKTDVLPDPATVEVADGNTGTFGDITYKEAGTYYYTITETARTDIPNMNYDIKPKYAKVVVALDTSTKKLEPTSVTYGTSKDECNDSSLTVTNTYYKITYQPKITKQLKQGNAVLDTTYWPTNGFTFVLAAVEDNPAGAALPNNQTATATATDNPAVFDAITFTKEGTFNFTITEQVPEGTTGIQYNTDPVNVEVTVSLNETTNKYVISEVKYGTDNPAEGDAVATAAGTQVNTWKTTDRYAKKAFAGDDNHTNYRPASITYTLSATDSDGATVNLKTDYGIDNTEQTIQNTVTGYEAEWTGLPEYTKAGKRITYDITETPVTYYTQTGKAWSDDGKTCTFTNTLGLSEKALGATKRMENGETLSDNYQFILTAKNNAPMPAGKSSPYTVHNVQGDVSFGTITYTLEDMKGTDGKYLNTKNFVYEITEEHTNATADNNYTVNGVKYDPAIYTATVTVTYNATTGKLSAADPTYTKKANEAATTSEPATSVAFTNELAGGLKITKEVKTDRNTLNVGNLANGTYYFMIYTDNSCETPATKLDGSTIGEIGITIGEGTGATKTETAIVEDLKAGTYYVKETGRTKLDIPLNETAMPVTVTAGVTGADTTAEEAQVTITNTYETVQISGTKTWSDKLNPSEHDAKNNTLLTLKRKIDTDSQYSEVDGFSPSWTQDTTNPNLYTYSYSNLPKYDADGNKYTYLVEETPPEDYVMLSSAGEGYGKNFVNKWATGSFVIQGKKGLNIGTLTDPEMGKYTFTLTAVTPRAPMPAEPGNKAMLSREVGSTADPTFSFGPINFKLIDLKTDATGEPITTTFEYKITETGEAAGIGNDTHTHTVELTVSVNNTDPTELIVTPEYLTDGYIVSKALSEFTNRKLYGNLELSKSVTGTSDPNKEFDFTILLKDETEALVAGKQYNAVVTTAVAGEDPTTDKTVSFDTNGKATVSLKANQSILIKDIPSGYTYTVTEAPVGGYSKVSPEGNVGGTITAGETDIKAFVNTYEATGTVSFSAKKVFTNGDWTGKTFKVRLSQVTGNNEKTLVTGTSLRMATNPIVKEINADTANYTVAFDDAASFLKSTVRDDTTLDEYWFMLEEVLPDGVDAQHPIKGGIEYDTTPKWIKVTVTDNKAGGLTVTKSVTDNPTATFTNTQLGSVKVTKVFADSAPIPDGFQITYKVGETPADEPLTIANADSGSGTQTSPYEWTISNLPIGTVVTFTESGIQVNGYSLTVNGTAVAGDTCQVTAEAAKEIDENDTAAFINKYTRDTGKLRLTKHVTLNGGNAGNLLDGTYTFNITGTGTDPKTTGTNRAVTITISGGVVTGGTIDGTNVMLVPEGNEKWIEVSGLPTGTYEVSEVTTDLEARGISLASANPQICEVVKDGGNATIPTATFTNNRGGGVLELRKTVELSPSVTDKDTHYNTEFTFAITLTNQDNTPISGTFTTKTGTYGTNDETAGSITFSNGAATATLKHNQVLKIEGLPLKAKYVISETGDSSSEFTYALISHSGDATGTISSSPSEESFVNSYNLDGTSITFGGTKTIKGTDSTDQEFKFELYKADDQYNITDSNPIETVTKGEITKDTGKPFSFSPIEYNKDTLNGQIFYYVIKEKALTDPNGWKISQQATKEYHVAVQVTKENVGTGHDKLTATIINGQAADKLNFLNTYEATGSTTFSATKVFTDGGDDWGGKTFEFKLSQVKANNDPTGVPEDTRLFAPQTIEVTKDEPTANFSALEFFKGVKDNNGTPTAINQEGEYWFMLEEELPDDVDEDHPIKDGIRYDTEKHWVKVTVTDQKNGTLAVQKSVTPANGEPDATFTNQQLGSVQITKAFDGHEMPDDFAITATYKIGTTEYSKTLKTTAGGGAIKPSKGSGKTNDPYVWEIKDLPLNTEVTFKETGITVNGYSLEVDGATKADDGMSATATALSAVDVGKVDLVNKYTRETGSLKLSKTVVVDTKSTATQITNTTLVDGEYTFTITGTGTNPKTTGVSKTVKVTISGGKITTATVDDQSVRKSDGTDVWAEVTGLPTGAYAVTEDTTGLGNKHIRLTAEPNGTLTVVPDGLTTIPTAPFTNTRDTGELEIRKQVTVDVPITPPNELFTFEISLKDGETPVSGTFAASGKNNGTDIISVTFTDGTAQVKLKVTESIVICDIPQGVTYTVKEINVPAGFKQSEPSGNLATGTIGSSRTVQTFKNKYTLVATGVTFGGTKTITGTDATEKVFEFELYETASDYDIEGTNANLLQTVSTDGEITRANGQSYTFTEITYEVPGTHYYVIREKAGTANVGWSYAENVYKEKVVVRNQPDGTLVPTVTGTTTECNALNFINEYSATGTISFSAEKNYTHGTLSQGQFSFRLKQVSAKGSESEPEQNKVILASPTTVAIGVDGKADLGTITFKKNKADGDQTGSYWFMIEEVLPDGVNADHDVKNHIKYDTQKYWINVTVTDKKDGTLEVTKQPKPETGKPDAVFTNDLLSKVRVSKAFDGHDVPADFQIRAEYKQDGTTVIRVLKVNAGTGEVAPVSGSGTKTDPYIWEIDDLTVGTKVVFTESGIQVNGYSLTVNGTATTDTTVTVEAAAQENVIAKAELVNDYIQKTEEKIIHSIVNIYKEDKSTKDPLEGAEFTLYSSVACNDADKIKTYNGKKFSIDTEDPVLTSYLPDDPAVTKTLYLKETKAPEDYVPEGKVHSVVLGIDISGPKYDADKDTFITTKTYLIKIDGEKTANIPNKKIDVRVQKTDVITGEELTGAHIQILDKDGKVVEEWDSEEGKPHEVKGLKTGVEYTLRETVAPEGYDITTDTTFTIDETGEVTSTGTVRNDGVLLVEDTKLPETSATVKKIWNDENNRDGKRPESLKIELLANGEKTGKSVTLSDQNGWISRISNLAKCTAVEHKEIKYSWAEPKVEGYTLSGNTANGTLTTLTNTCTPETTQINVRKVWVDDGQHPNEVKVQLYADGQALGEAVTLNEGNGWTYSWNDLCKYDEGREIRYTVAETEIPKGYAAKITGSMSAGYVITNTLQKGTLVIRKQFDIQEPEKLSDEEELKTEIQVVKIWDDNDNKDGNRPEKITIRLYAGGQEVKTAELSEKNGWRRTFGDLPKFVDGHPIRYSVKEDPVKWYVTKIKGFTITNRYQPEMMSVAVRKAWDDAGSEQFRPKSVIMKLNNGMSIELNEKNGWSGVITDLPKYVNGKEAEYTWSESEVLGYQIKSTVVEGNLTVITNAPFENDGTPKGKKPASRGEKTIQIDDYRTPLGVNEMINHVGDCFD